GCRAIPNWSAYATSKAALIRLSETLALERAASGGRVFLFHSGSGRTDVTQEALQSDEARRLVPGLAAIFDRGEETAIDDSVAFLMRIARGEGDALSGRFITVRDALTSLGAPAADTLTLRLVQPPPAVA